MSATLFTTLIKKGKTQAYIDFIRECMGPRKKEYEDLLARYHLNTIKIWVSTLGGRDYAIFTHDMDDDAPKFLENWSGSTHPFDQWFDKNLSDCYEVEDVTKSSTQFLGEIDTRI